jgi:hypothetical protein
VRVEVLEAIEGEAEERVVVAAIAAAKRRPGYWLYRLRS